VRRLVGNLNALDREVTTITLLPDDHRAVLTVAHGAGTKADHPILELLADAFAAVRIATVRYNFPFAERGGGRDARASTFATIRAAVSLAGKSYPGTPLFAGGHSFGGRMKSLLAADETLQDVQGLMLFGFPLHRVGRPKGRSTSRTSDSPSSSSADPSTVRPVTFCSSGSSGS
jgi:predicted alpha/beta-hydrolase family hydrolase